MNELEGGFDGGTADVGADEDVDGDTDRDTDEITGFGMMEVVIVVAADVGLEMISVGSAGAEVTAVEVG